jgi:hypothetical protein
VSWSICIATIVILSPETAAAAAAKYFAAMKKWEEQNVDVTKHIMHVVGGRNPCSVESSFDADCLENEF